VVNGRVSALLFSSPPPTTSSPTSNVRKMKQLFPDLHFFESLVAAIASSKIVFRAHHVIVRGSVFLYYFAEMPRKKGGFNIDFLCC
jgi:hypothetical protein